MQERKGGEEDFFHSFHLFFLLSSVLSSFNIYASFPPFIPSFFLPHHFLFSSFLHSLLSFLSFLSILLATLPPFIISKPCIPFSFLAFIKYSFLPLFTSPHLPPSPPLSPSTQLHLLLFFSVPSTVPLSPPPPPPSHILKVAKGSISAAVKGFPRDALDNLSRHLAGSVGSRGMVERLTQRDPSAYAGWLGTFLQGGIVS